MTHNAPQYFGQLNQRGGSLSDIVLYEGPTHHHHHHQSGAGLGNFFNAAFHALRPLFRSGINALKSQGIKSTQSVLSQLGKKDLSTILKEEGEKAVNDLSKKALNKLSRMNGIVNDSNQVGSGQFNTMPLGLSPLQIDRFRRYKAGAGQSDSSLFPVKSIKRARAKRSTQMFRKRRVGFTKIKKRPRKKQIGAGRRKKQIGAGIRKRQIGAGKKRRRRLSTKTKRVKKPRSKVPQDIFI